jgi:hypothetical protein
VKSLVERFEAKIEPEPNSGCWIWLGCRDKAGYGRVSVKGLSNLDVENAHRVAYELFRGSIPIGHVIDHLCRNKWCVNPAHLDAVPQRLNLARGVGLPWEINRKKTHCPAGQVIKAQMKKAAETVEYLAMLLKEVAVE